MRSRLSILLAVSALIICGLSLPSCRKKCCDCADSKLFKGRFCEDDLPANFSSWEGCKAALKEGGCRCD